ncbi:MAG: zinc-binding dehydrogenase [Ignavibacteria bacterium]
MRSLVLHKTGSSENYSSLFRIEEKPMPEFSDEEILIKIECAALNHRDLYIAEGAYSKIKLPVILGSDGAGIVFKTGENVTQFNVGDKVIIYPCKNWGASEEFQNRNIEILGMPQDGTFSEFIKVHHSRVFKFPDHLNFSEAASFPLAGLTAYRALFEKAKLANNDNILITGAGGGVSSMSLIFAIASGARVFVTSGSNEKIAKAVLLGAAGGVNYRDENWHEELHSISENKIDVIIDGTGGENYTKLIEIISYGGRIISYGATLGASKFLDLHKVYWKQLKIMGTTMGTDKDFSDMLNFIEANKIKPVIDSIHNLSDYFNAFDRMKNSEQFGKIILEIDSQKKNSVMSFKHSKLVKGTYTIQHSLKQKYFQTILQIKNRS